MALLLSALVVTLAYWRNSLSASGAVAALLVGTLTYGFGGWVWGVVLILFFVTASLLSHYRVADKQVVAQQFDKGHRRDWGQVMANGGVGMVVAVLQGFAPSSIWFLLFLGAMATVTADTWATELGTLSKRAPRMITTGRVVPAGTSGGISAIGVVVSLSGGLFIGVIAGWLTQHNVFLFALIGGFAGLVGSLVDSLLGATVQQIYYCDQCQKETEKKHHCNQTPRPLRGWARIDNDWVNALSSTVGGATALALYLLWS